jgi:exodeoxyribonuclease VII small subunit
MPAPPDDAPNGHAPANAPPAASFEAGLSQLGDIVNRLEAGGLGLSESIAAYERGVAILRHLHDELNVAEQRVRILTGVDEEGQPITKSLATPPPGDQAAAAGTASTPEAEKPAKRAAPRVGATGKATRSKALPGMDDSSEGV